jgi:hypothetical protein
MRTKLISRNTLALVLALTGPGAGSIAAVQAQETTSALVTQLYDGQWPDKDTVTQLNKERLYQRGIEAYMMDLREGSCNRTPFEPDERKKDQFRRLSANCPYVFGHHEHLAALV